MKLSKLDQRDNSKQWQRTLCFSFSYEGGSVQLIVQRSIDMRPPPPERVPILQGQSGFWYELRDTQDRMIYQRAAYNPIRFDIEVFSDDQPGTISRRRLPRPHGTFELLAPDLPEARTLVVFSSPPEPEAATRPATELIRLNIARGPSPEVI
jgi:hypothetical protein